MPLRNWRASPFLFLLILITAWLLVSALSGCSDGRTVGITPATKVEPGAALSSDIKELAEELKNVRARERLLVGALDDARTDALQTKLWMGAGACFLAAIVLVGIGIWTSRRILIEIGVVAGGLGGLLIFFAWLAPYALWIGIAVAVLMICIAVYMLVNRQKGLEQVTRAVDAIKPALPGYREVFNQFIDTGPDHLLDHVRKNRKD
jgi:hypothetical protein